MADERYTSVREGHVQVATREGYDRWSTTYDDGTNPLIGLDDRLVRPMIGEVAGLDVVDLGCGTGRNAIWMAGAGAKVTGIDGSPGMLTEAYRHLRGLDVRLVRGDLAGRLPFRDSSFDLAVSALVLEHLSDLPLFFAETRRICRSDARFIMSALHPDMFERGVQARFIDPMTGRKTFMHSFDHKLDDIVRAARQAGWLARQIMEERPDATLCRDFPKIADYRDCRLLLAVSFVQSLEHQGS